MVGPTIPACDAIHAEKYRGPNESFREAMNRIAGCLQDDHDHYMSFRQILLDMRFLPAGRPQAAIGSMRTITAQNCFVMSTIHDSFVDGPAAAELAALEGASWAPRSIMDVAKDAAATMRQGGGVGYDMSTLRPKGDQIRGVQAVTDGPLRFARIFDAVCEATSSAGNRRGAQMMVLRVDHPDIESFIRAKQVSKNVPYEFRPLRGFNMSVAITDEFMECLYAGKPFPLKFGGRVYREVDPESLWSMIMRGTYDWAEPGVLFIDTINRMNNLWYCEQIAATNPCGEQPLPPYGSCLLGSFNLVKYVGSNSRTFDYDLLAHDVPHVVRSMDNIVDRSRYPLNQQREEAHNKRRMGLGVTGLANALEAMGYSYGSPEFVAETTKILEAIKNLSYMASCDLAREKGSFPLFDRERYCNGQFFKTLDPRVQDMIRASGLRNSHLTSIAPTGTISLCSDNVSSGIEPVFGYAQRRRVISPEGPREVEIEDYGSRVFGVKGRRCQDVTAGQHVAVLAAAQAQVDSAVSKTCNVPEKYPYEDFVEIYLTAYSSGCKGCTTYRPNGNYEDVVRSVDEPQTCSIDPKTGQRTGACAEN